MIRSIVLTYDKYHFIANHMLLCYEKLWPDNPFVFIIPFQKLKTAFSIDKSKYKLIQTPPDIKSTVLELLSEINDEEIIYWCMDDRYPITLDINVVSVIYKWFIDNSDHMDGVSYTLSSKDNSIKYSHIFSQSIRGPFNIVFYKKKHYGSIWSHQFIKTKVLRYFFENMPGNIIKAKEMDDYLKNEATLPQGYNIYVSSKSYGLFGESTSRGKITQNCYNSMSQNNIPINNGFKVTGEKIINNIDHNTNNKMLWRIKDILKNL